MFHWFRDQRTRYEGIKSLESVSSVTDAEFADCELWLGGHATLKINRKSAHEGKNDQIKRLAPPHFGQTFRYWASRIPSGNLRNNWEFLGIGMEVRVRISKEKLLTSSGEARGASRGRKISGNVYQNIMVTTIDTCGVNAGLRHSRGAESPSWI